jgi:GDP-L-fucose synthase
VNERVLVTGGRGFLGTHVLAALKARGYTEVFAPKSSEFDLTKQRDVVSLFWEYQPHVVIHLAARVGGIGANQKNPGSFLHDNAVMGLNMIEQARQHFVKKFIQIGTVCSYPKFTEVPFKEDDLWLGYPEETNAPYGLAKKLLLTQGQAYREQYGFNSIYLIPTNLYGPYDNFDPQTSHVIPALIRNFDEAIKSGSKSVTVWGTGNASREFLYAEDCANGIVKAMEAYDQPEPVNLGTGIEIRIRTLARFIAMLMAFEGEILFDSSKPDGQPRRCLDVSRAKAFGFEAKTDLIAGLSKTIEWYRRQS